MLRAQRCWAPACCSPHHHHKGCCSGFWQRGGRSHNAVLSTQAWPDTAAQLGWDYPRVLPSSHLLSPCNKADPGGALFRPPRAALPLPHISRAAKPLRSSFQMLQTNPAERGCPSPGHVFPLPRKPESRMCPLHPARLLLATELSAPDCPRCEVLCLLPHG